MNSLRKKQPKANDDLLDTFSNYTEMQLSPVNKAKKAKILKKAAQDQDSQLLSRLPNIHTRNIDVGFETLVKQDEIHKMKEMGKFHHRK